MNDFGYARVDTVQAALQAMRTHPGAMLLAGGTTVVDLLREDVFAPDTVIDIGGLPLREIKVGRDETVIGALVPNSELAWNRAIVSLFPVVSQALLAGASGQIRNMASVGGNLLQRTRCPYFRQLEARCNKRDPGTGCAAVEGFNRSHAIFGGSDHCVATHPSDFTVALTAVDARIHLLGPDGEREVPITEFYLEPGDTPQRENRLQPGELILGVKLPHAPAGRGSHYLKVRDRQSYEFALASAAVALDASSGVMSGVRIALGGVATVPWRARAAEQLLEGRRPSAALLAEAGGAAAEGARPLRDNAFKVALVRRTVIAALHQVTGLPPGPEPA
jgi:xanthine dehydrogenase YagS FAD-binding subunit